MFSGFLSVQPIVIYLSSISNVGLGISPNIIFEKLITNESLKKQIELSIKAKDLPDDKIKFLIDIIDSLKEI